MYCLAESSDDDLIVVKTEYNTVDPITKKEIVDPVRNKRCNHVYERSTIYSMIDLARYPGPLLLYPVTND
jgi:SUMO ligase MMS21 Smc5/6 complex component